MLIMRSILSLFAILALTTTPSRGEGKAFQQYQVERARQFVAESERALQLYTHAYARCGSYSELVNAMITLERAKMRLASLENNSHALHASLSRTVEFYEANWKNIKVKNAADEARIGLATARIHLELHAIVMARESQLAAVKTLVAEGKVHESRIAEVQRALADARLRFQPYRP